MYQIYVVWNGFAPQAKPRHTCPHLRQTLAHSPPSRCVLRMYLPALLVRRRSAPTPPAMAACGIGKLSARHRSSRQMARKKPAQWPPACTAWRLNDASASFNPTRLTLRPEASIAMRTTYRAPTHGPRDPNMAAEKNDASTYTDAMKVPLCGLNSASRPTTFGSGAHHRSRRASARGAMMADLELALRMSANLPGCCSRGRP